MIESHALHAAASHSSSNANRRVRLPFVVLFESDGSSPTSCGLFCELACYLGAYQGSVDRRQRCDGDRKMVMALGGFEHRAKHRDRQTASNIRITEPTRHRGPRPKSAGSGDTWWVHRKPTTRKLSRGNDKDYPFLHNNRPTVDE